MTFFFDATDTHGVVVRTVCHTLGERGTQIVWQSDKSRVVYQKWREAAMDHQIGFIVDGERVVENDPHWIWGFIIRVAQWLQKHPNS